MDSKPADKQAMLNRYSALLLAEQAVRFVNLFCGMVVLVGVVGILYGLIMLATHPGTGLQVENWWFGIVCAIGFVATFYLRRKIKVRLNEAKKTLVD